MKGLILGRTRSAGLQFARYVVVGGVAAGADTGCLYILHARLAVNYLAAAAAGFLLGLLVNYLISIAWVFESTGRLKEEFALFAIIGIAGLGWTELILWAGVSLAHAPVMAAKAAALVLVLIWNFGMRKKFVFSARLGGTGEPRPGG